MQKGLLHAGLSLPQSGIQLSVLIQLMPITGLSHAPCISAATHPVRGVFSATQPMPCTLASSTARSAQKICVCNADTQIAVVIFDCAFCPNKNRICLGVYPAFLHIFHKSAARG